MKKKTIKGFTLIELLIAMTIAAILMGLALVSYQGSKKAARDSKRKADLEQIRSAIEIYRSDCKQYPPGITSAQPLTGCPGDTTQVTYINSVPQDPGSCRYYYLRRSLNSYILCASLETGNSQSDNECGNNCGNNCPCNYKTTNP